jgi:hypothetical protein
MEDKYKNITTKVLKTQDFIEQSLLDQEVQKLKTLEQQLRQDTPISQDTPEDILEDTSEDIPEDILEDIPEDVSVDVPIDKLVHVPVDFEKILDDYRRIMLGPVSIDDDVITNLPIQASLFLNNQTKFCGDFVYIAFECLEKAADDFSKVMLFEFYLRIFDIPTQWVLPATREVIHLSTVDCIDSWLEKCMETVLTPRNISDEISILTDGLRVYLKNSGEATLFLVKIMQQRQTDEVGFLRRYLDMYLDLLTDYIKSICAKYTEVITQFKELLSRLVFTVEALPCVIDIRQAVNDYHQKRPSGDERIKKAVKIMNSSASGANVMRRYADQTLGSGCGIESFFHKISITLGQHLRDLQEMTKKHLMDFEKQLGPVKTALLGVQDTIRRDQQGIVAQMPLELGLVAQLFNLYDLQKANVWLQYREKMRVLMKELDSEQLHGYMYF